MTYRDETEPVLRMVSTAGPWGPLTPSAVAANFASVAWETAELAVYMPIYVPVVCSAKRMWWANGATTTGGATVEAGVYRDGGFKPGTKLGSKSAVQGTASQVQFVTLDAAVTLTPGLWWVALMMSSATNTTVVSTLLSVSVDISLRFSQITCNPLPATATPAESAGGTFPLCGFSTTT